ncbi:MAG: isoprenylcysteine carboxylmethyltransferase family protein [Catenulispora sp.]|nr:isoprenylcysteine carboxylmethyltransferase family protein [Catenulispora sp.]
MKRFFLIAYATIAYGGFLAVFGWAFAFLAGSPSSVGIDRSGTHTATAVAVVIDLLLLGLFAMHHSVMARPAAKRLVTRVVPAAAERSTYVLTADALLALVLWQWRPIGGTVWDVQTQPARGAIWALYALGWVIAVSSTFMIDHFDLVGLRQAASRDYQRPAFQQRRLYRVIRHPIMAGFLIAFWSTPAMSRGHLLFSAAASAYILVGVTLEERDLRRELGAVYEDYASRTPAVIPRPTSARASSSSSIDSAS